MKNQVFTFFDGDSIQEHIAEYVLLHAGHQVQSGSLYSAQEMATIHIAPGEDYQSCVKTWLISEIDAFFYGEYCEQELCGSERGLIMLESIEQGSDYLSYHLERFDHDDALCERHELRFILDGGTVVPESGKILQFYCGGTLNNNYYVSAEIYNKDGTLSEIVFRGFINMDGFIMNFCLKESPQQVKQNYSDWYYKTTFDGVRPECAPPEVMRTFYAALSNTGLVPWRHIETCEEKFEPDSKYVYQTDESDFGDVPENQRYIYHPIFRSIFGHYASGELCTVSESGKEDCTIIDVVDCFDDFSYWHSDKIAVHVLDFNNIKSEEQINALKERANVVSGASVI